jgi:Leucine-rich repeat (LRR) protein
MSRVANPAALCSFGNLKILSLSDLQINSLGFLSACTNLSELGLNRLPINSVQDLPSTLKKVSLVDVPVVDISPLLLFANLESLTLLRVPARADVISELERRGVKVTNQ